MNSSTLILPWHKSTMPRCWAGNTFVSLNFRWSDHFVSAVVSLKRRKQGSLNPLCATMFNVQWGEQCVDLQSSITAQRINEQLITIEKWCSVHRCSVALSNWAHARWIRQACREEACEVIAHLSSIIQRNGKVQPLRRAPQDWASLSGKVCLCIRDSSVTLIEKQEMWCRQRLFHHH